VYAGTFFQRVTTAGLRDGFDAGVAEQGSQCRANAVSPGHAAGGEALNQLRIIGKIDAGAAAD